jgi:hypothetical protein
MIVCDINWEGGSMMRRKTLAAVMSVWLLSCAGLWAAILPGNFLPNPSVEEDVDQDGVPDGWLRGGNNPAGDIWDDSEPVTGDYSLLLLDESDASYTSWYTNVDLPQDVEEFALQWTWRYAFTSENPSDEFRMTIAWRSQGTDIGYQHVVVREDQPDYVTEYLELFRPEDSDALRLEFVSAGPQTEMGVMYIDDISLAPLGATFPGDVNGDGAVDVADIDALTQAVFDNSTDLRFDVDGDQAVTADDRLYWIKEIQRTYLGDANLDNEFSSSDLVQVFAGGKYELDADAGWGEGDWNGDRRFGSGDLVVAFADGGYEQGPRAAVSAVPEPTGIGFAAVTLAWIAVVSSRRHARRA